MNMILLRAGALSCALLASTSLAAPAFAQTAEPAHRVIDPNGVDLISGTYPLSLFEGTIGSGEAAITLVRHGTNPEGIGNWQNMYLTQTIAGSVKTVDVALGDHSERFSSTSGGAFVAAQGNGAALTGGAGGYAYNDGHGTSIAFGSPMDDALGASNLCGHANANQNGCMQIAVSQTGADVSQVDFVYDTHSNCSSIINDDGSVDCLYYWRLASVDNSYGYGVDFSYVSNSAGGIHAAPSANWFKRAGATLTNGATTRTVTNTFVSSTVTQVTDADGRTWQFTTGTNSLGIRRPGSSVDDISVTFSGGIVTQVVRDGIATAYSRSVSGSTATTTITDALSHVTTVVANTSLGRITSIANPLSNTTSLQYDSNGRLTRTTLSEGNYTALTYDGRGNVTEARSVAKSGSGMSDIVTSATFPSTCPDASCNQPITTTDANGNVTDYTYHTTHGGVLTVTGPAPLSGGDRPQTRYSYTLTNGEYQLTGISVCSSGTTASTPNCVGTANEAQTVTGYDANGNMTSVERRDGTGALTSTLTATYDGAGNLLTVDGPISGTSDTTRYRYNGARQVIGIVGPDPDGGSSLNHRAIKITYGSDGQPTRREIGTVNSQSDSDWTSFTTLEEVQTEYDSHHRPFVGRLVSSGTTYALTQTGYDSLGRVSCIAQRMNPSEFATTSLPSDACTLDTQGSYGPDRIVQSLYDDAGQLVRTRTAVGTALERDVVVRGYTANGQVGYVIDGEDNLTDYVHDGHDRLEYTYFPSPTQGALAASMTDYERLAYDDAGNVVSRRLRDGTSIAYTYDHLNRLTGKNLPGSELDVAYTFDLLNRMISAYTSAQTLTFGFDVLGRNTSQAGPRGTVGYAYDPAGRRTQMTYADSGLYVNYDYDVAGDLTAIRENGSTSGIGVLATYTYDDRGRRTLLHRGNGTDTTYSYGYSAGLRTSAIAQDLLSSGSDVTFNMTYNPASQIATREGAHGGYAWQGHYALNRGYSVNGLNQYTASGSITPAYDSRANVTSAGSITYGYGSENMLVSASGGVTLGYDPALRLYETVGGGVTTRMAYDGDQLIAEYNSSNVLQRRYVYGPATDEPLVWYEGTGTSDRRWLHADERGSVVAISNASGNAAGYNSYDEYGIPAAGNIGRFQYTGQQWIAELGMYHYRARIYSPTLGRFLQSDPIGYQGGMNLYAYVANDPINLTDPMGLAPPQPKPDPGCDHRDGEGNCDAPVVTARKPRHKPEDPVDPGFGGDPRFHGGSSGEKRPGSPRCTGPVAERNYPVPDGHTASPYYPNHTQVLNSDGRLVINPAYEQARIEAGAHPGPARARDLLGPNPGAVGWDLVAIAGASAAGVYYIPADIASAIVRAALAGAAAGVDTSDKAIAEADRARTGQGCP